MGSSFDFLAPILTPAALRSVQADGRPVITLFLVIFGLSIFGTVIWYVHFVTSKMYPKKKDPNAKPKILGFISRSMSSHVDEHSHRTLNFGTPQRSTPHTYSSSLRTGGRTPPAS
ncbi:hypothetical protein TUN199_03849 [Pyrenophora tritici-repentis]|nr:hypothetical protein PtrV1_12239 [Pyrenophora tritici-repentis]KAF7445044.1 hypothetical protein A1F99_100290 [Pyrenophora tritici-repentis]KAI0575341.1 hypothetical protein Alg215_08065 [Pyrenophora tritici-repentis]KAI0587458.1 hypothetical protein Alg130_03822 [Pyrenophora tritici-repentis]KAI0611970.1 hypothetical protein TUN205_03769 [Pyrenophora tritici-repentis]